MFLTPWQMTACELSWNISQSQKKYCSIAELKRNSLKAGLKKSSKNDIRYSQNFSKVANRRCCGFAIVIKLLISNNPWKVLIIRSVLRSFGFRIWLVTGRKKLSWNVFFFESGICTFTALDFSIDNWWVLTC